MKDPDDDLRQTVALFRYGVIADLVQLPAGTPGIGAMLRARAERIYVIPGSTRTRIAAETMRTGSRTTGRAASRRSTRSRAPTAASPGVCRPGSPTA